VQGSLEHETTVRGATVHRIGAPSTGQFAACRRVEARARRIEQGGLAASARTNDSDDEFLVEIIQIDVRKSGPLP
jgi:hypothetical protein